MRKLTARGHDVLTAAAASVVTVSDLIVFQKAIVENRIVLTINCNDFVAIAKDFQSKTVQFPGVFLLYKYNEESKDMSYDEIVKAIANLEGTQTPIANLFHSLNRYNW
jgi:hypothetical protein